MWKLLAKKHPDSIIEQFPLQFNEAINNTNTEKLIIPYYRTSIGKKSLLYQKYKIWNIEIPANIKNKESYNNFAKNYYKYLLDEIWSIESSHYHQTSSFVFYSCNCYFSSNLILLL